MRAHGEGTIYPLPNGRYRAQITLSGQRLSKTGDLPTCRSWLKTLARQRDDGLTYQAAKTTLAQFLASYLATLAHDLRPKTHTHYTQLAHQYLLPALGSLTLRSLRPETIQNYYNTLSQTHSPYLIKKIHTLLHKTLAHAVRLGVLPRNPAGAALIILPRQPHKEMRLLTETQITALLISVRGTRYEALYHLALNTGARQNELLALQWTDLDWLTGDLKIERQLQFSPAGWNFAPLKTRYSRRIITLGARTLALLRDHLTRQQTDRLLAGQRWNENNLVFPNTFGAPLIGRNLTRTLHQHLTAAGLPQIRFHDLRHTAAALMLNHGIPPIIASRRLGHSKPSITLDIYGHLIPQAQRALADQLDDLLTPIPLSENQLISKSVQQ